MSVSISRSAPRVARVTRRITFPGLLITAGVIVFLTFWTWALLFASKEAINKIEDLDWTQRAEEICAESSERREALADFRRIDPQDLDMLIERGDLIDRSTDILESMLTAVMSQPLTSEKGTAIVPQWADEYRTYIANRRVYAEAVRNGSNDLFREAEAGGIPISQRLTVFANDNQMSSCAPPRDL
jgi:hypothetical protein